MKLSDLGKLISRKELNKIKKKVAKMNPKQVEEELKLRLNQFADITKKLNPEDESEDKEKKNE